MRRISNAVYAVSVLGAFTFGASQAFGRAVQQTCPYDPPTWLGACVNLDEEECRLRCFEITGDPDSKGECHVGAWYGCCICLMR